LALPGVPLHIIQRGNNRQACFFADEDRLITPHPVYTSLAVEALDRCTAYRELFRHQLATGLVDEIRKATNGNFALGDHRFAAASAAAIGRRVTPGKSGRPRNVHERVSGILFD